MQSGVVDRARSVYCIGGGKSPLHKQPPDTLLEKTVLAVPLCSDGLKYALDSNQSCPKSDKPPLSGSAVRGK